MLKNENPWRWREICLVFPPSPKRWMGLRRRRRSRDRGEDEEFVRPIQKAFSLQPTPMEIEKEEEKISWPRASRLKAPGEGRKLNPIKIFPKEFYKQVFSSSEIRLPDTRLKLLVGLPGFPLTPPSSSFISPNWSGGREISRKKVQHLRIPEFNFFSSFIAQPQRRAQPIKFCTSGNKWDGGRKGEKG